MSSQVVLFNLATLVDLCEQMHVQYRVIILFLTYFSYILVVIGMMLFCHANTSWLLNLLCTFIIEFYLLCMLIADTVHGTLQCYMVVVVRDVMKFEFEFNNVPI